MSLLVRVSGRLIGSMAKRLPAGSPAKRKLVDTVLWQLPQVSYSRLFDRGFRPKGIIDVGACSGDWTREVMAVFPEAPALMLEARAEERNSLKRACDELGAEFEIALLGREHKESVAFHVNGSASSLFKERSDTQFDTHSMTMQTLDEVVLRHPKLREPLFLKMDLQGAELEVMRGADRVLSLTEVVQLEVPLLHYNDGAPEAIEILTFMDMRGFAIYEIAGFVRPNQVDLVQIDILFCRKDSPLRRDFFVFQN